MVLPDRCAAGGSSGQVLSKSSGTDYDTAWVDNTSGSGGHDIKDEAALPYN